MKYENIDIKKLQQFCKILVKLGITKKIYGTTTFKKIVSVREYQQFMQNVADCKIKVEGRPEWKVATREKVWNIKKQQFEVLNNIVFLKDIEKYGMTEEEFYNQKVELSYKLCNKRHSQRMTNLLSKYLGISIEQANNTLLEKDGLKGVVQYFAKNSKRFSVFSLHTREAIINNKLTTMLFLSFANSNFKIELGI